MAKPIPVFSFVFAAYAATSAASDFSSPPPAIKTLQPGDPFLTALRTRSSRNGPLFAKVGLSAAATTDALHFATRSSGEIYEDLWLMDIVETRLGFVGEAMHGQNLPSRIKPGQRLRFHQINVLEWRLGDCKKACATPTRECVNRQPRASLAQLSETVGS